MIENFLGIRKFARLVASPSDASKIVIHTENYANVLKYGRYDGTFYPESHTMFLKMGIFGYFDFSEGKITIYVSKDEGLKGRIRYEGRTSGISVIPEVSNQEIREFTREREACEVLEE